MKINQEEIIESLKSSGYFLESRILEKLSVQKYQNFPNQTYPDPITNKSREIDIISNGPRITENLKLNDFLHFEFRYDLVIECINNIQPVAFFKRPDKDPYSIFGKFYYEKSERECIEPNIGDTPEHEFHNFTTISKEFHYNLMPKNSQYCSFSPKKGNPKEWMASHPDALHDTFGKLNDYIKHSMKDYQKWIKKSNWKKDVFIIIKFPILILQNDLIEVSEKRGMITIEKKNHLIFDSKKYSDDKEGFLIDIITENYLPEYLNLVNNSMIKLKNVIVEFYQDKKIVEIDYSKMKKTTGNTS